MNTSPHPEWSIIKVVVNGPIAEALDYKISGSELPPVGSRVWVPLGKRVVVGMVVGYADNSRLPAKKLKSIGDWIDREPLLSEDALALMAFASRYYHYPIGQTLLENLPAALKKGQSWSDFDWPPLPMLSEDNSHSLATRLLTEAQKKALATIDDPASSGFRSHLLFGITGSGKTEVYLQLAEARSHQQVLVLVPEIGLTPQLLIRFQERMPHRRILPFHSGLTPKQRLATWYHASRGDADVVVGTRSAIFIPMPRLSLIVVDEEHDPSFKQQDSLRYSARDLALYRARQRQIPIVLGSATPSLETYAHAIRGKHQLISLPKRAGQSLSPDFRVVDLRKKPLAGGLAPEVLAAIQERLDKKEQVLIFLNRRGYAPTTLCHTCGMVAECPACDARLIWHEKDAWLMCHHCERKMHKGLCTHCGADALTPVGYGTERMEGFLKERFDQEVLRFDRDNMKSKKKWVQALSDIRDNRVHLIVGTQMLAKGHDFPNVTLVVIVDVDQGLYSSDFRSQERLAQLIMQVSGRAGRGDKPGEVYLQTHEPHHSMLELLLKKGYAHFAANTLRERQEASLPPLTYSALIRADSKDEEAPFAYLSAVQKMIAQIKTLRQKNHLDCLGPVAPRLAKLAHYHRAQLLINTPCRSDLHDIIEIIQPKMLTIRVGRVVRAQIEVDPQEMG